MNLPVRARRRRMYRPTASLKSMPLSVARVLPARVGKIVLVCAISSVCAAYMLSHERAMRIDDPDVSLVSKDFAPPAAPSAAQAPPAASSAPATQPPTFTVKKASVGHSFAAAVQSMGVDARTADMLARAFRGDLDVSREVRPGDQVSAVFDRSDDTQAAHAPLAVRVVRGTTAHDVFLYTDLRGEPFYYPKDGASPVPAFERYP